MGKRNRYGLGSLAPRRIIGVRAPYTRFSGYGAPVTTTSRYGLGARSQRVALLQIANRYNLPMDVTRNILSYLQK